jgi:hypothetical protein
LELSGGHKVQNSFETNLVSLRLRSVELHSPDGDLMQVPDRAGSVDAELRGGEARSEA